MDLHQRRAGRADVAAVLVFLALGLVLTAGYLAAPDRMISRFVPSDNTWFEWLLAHGAYTVRHLGNPFFSHRQNGPDGVNMMANTSVLGVTLPLAPLTLLAGPPVSYALWLLGGCAATATTAYWALSRHLVRSRVAATLGGAFAGFAPGVVHHANGQPNFVANFLLPLIVVRVLRLPAAGHPVRDGVRLGLLVVWQLFINEELLLLTAGAAGGALLAYVRRRRTGAAGVTKGLGATAAVVAVLGGYPLRLQFAGPQSYRGLPMFHDWGEDLQAFVTLSHDSLGGVATGERVLGRTEQNTWYGWPLVIAVLVAAVLLWRASAAARTAVVIGLAGALGALGPRIRVGGHVTGLPGPWALVPRRLPVFALVLPSRLAFLVTGAIAVLVALGWDALAERARRHRDSRRADLARLGQLGLAAALLPLIPAPLVTVPDRPLPHFFASGAWRRYVPPGSALVPMPLPDYQFGRSGLAWSALTGLEFPIARGYFLGPDADGDARIGAVPDATDRQVQTMLATARPLPATAADRAALRADLVRWHASVVVLDPGVPYLKPWLDGVLGPGRAVDDVWLWDVRQ